MRYSDQSLRSSLANPVFMFCCIFAMIPYACRRLPLAFQYQSIIVVGQNKYFLLNWPTKSLVFYVFL